MVVFFSLVENQIVIICVHEKRKTEYKILFDGKPEQHTPSKHGCEKQSKFEGSQIQSRFKFNISSRSIVGKISNETATFQPFN